MMVTRLAVQPRGGAVVIRRQELSGGMSLALASDRHDPVSQGMNFLCLFKMLICINTGVSKCQHINSLEHTVLS